MDGSQWGQQTDSRLRNLESSEAAASPWLMRLEDFKQTARKDIEDLQRFKGETLTRLGNFENFKDKEFAPWKTDTDKRLVELEKKNGENAAWKDKVNGLLGGLEKDKLSISDYKADKDRFDTRLGALEDFKRQMASIFTRDQSKNEKPLGRPRKASEGARSQDDSHRHEDQQHQPPRSYSSHWTSGTEVGRILQVSQVRNQETGREDQGHQTQPPSADDDDDEDDERGRYRRTYNYYWCFRPTELPFTQRHQCPRQQQPRHSHQQVWRNFTIPNHDLLPSPDPTPGTHPAPSSPAQPRSSTPGQFQQQSWGSIPQQH